MSKEYIINNMELIITLFTGVIFLFSGLLFSTYKKNKNLRSYSLNSSFIKGLFGTVLSLFSGLPLLRRVKQQFKVSLKFTFSKDAVLNVISDIMIFVIAVISVLLVVFLNRIGQLWYVKVMIIVMSVILPYYLMALLLDLYKYKMNAQIPKVIDEFRSAFIEHNKIKPALRECSRHVNKNIGRLILHAADSSDTQKAFEDMRGKIDNIWFSIFIVMLSNYKENGGELIAQLYKLNNTMSTQNSIEKKKNRRLVWYEVFAVCASVLSIPAVLWVNRIILGNGITLDPDTNLAICRVIIFSVISLVVVKVLRKM